MVCQTSRSLILIIKVYLVYLIILTDIFILFAHILHSNQLAMSISRRKALVRLLLAKVEKGTTFCFHLHTHIKSFCIYAIANTFENISTQTHTQPHQRTHAHTPCRRNFIPLRGRPHPATGGGGPFRPEPILCVSQDVVHGCGEPHL